MPASEPTGSAVPLSACVITFNEADRIADCLRSLTWCDELLVVDSHSTDATRTIAAQLGARIIERDWAGFGPQKEWAVRAALHDWVLCLDSDERVSPELRDAIVSAQRAGFAGAVGYDFPRQSWYLGAWIHHGVWYPDRCLRLFDRRHGRWSADVIHERVELDRPPRHLQQPLLHYPYRDLSAHLATIDRYSTLVAGERYRARRRVRLVDLIARPAAGFLQSYVFKGGFLDGWRGLLIAALHAHYVRMKYAKLLILNRRLADQP